ncbi:hypothetical protein HDE_06193 [Halotydeus destructor]|nr:hypothetical protein HDE_06193 [Halotydeus destructor]
MAISGDSLAGRELKRPKRTLAIFVDSGGNKVGIGLAWPSFGRRTCCCPTVTSVVPGGGATAAPGDVTEAPAADTTAAAVVETTAAAVVETTVAAAARRRLEPIRGQRRQKAKLIRASSSFTCNCPSAVNSRTVKGRQVKAKRVRQLKTRLRTGQSRLTSTVRPIAGSKAQSKVKPVSRIVANASSVKRSLVSPTASTPSSLPIKRRAG